MTVTVVYDTRVYVEVDVEERRVVKVTVGDTEAALDRDGSLLMADIEPGNEAPGEVALVDAAVGVAEEADWPPWDFG